MPLHKWCRRHPHALALFEELQPHIERSEWEVVGQLALQTLNRNVDSGANDFLQELLAVAETSPIQERSRLLGFAARSLEFLVPSPPILHLLATAVTDFWIKLPDSMGNLRQRSEVNTADLYLYDQPMAALRECGKEVFDEVSKTWIGIFAQTFDQDTPAEGVLQICAYGFARGEEVKFRGTAAWEVLEEKFSSYHKLHPFIGGDAEKFRTTPSIPLKWLISRHGPRAFYYARVEATGTTSFSWQNPLSVMFEENELSRYSSFPAEILNVLLKAGTPWLRRDDIKVSDFYLVGKDTGVSKDIATRSAVLLLRLPLVELLGNHGAGLGADDIISNPGMLPHADEILKVLTAIRAGQAPGGEHAVARFRSSLQDQGFREDFISFVFGWAADEFDLIAS